MLAWRGILQCFPPKFLPHPPTIRRLPPLVQAGSIFGVSSCRVGSVTARRMHDDTRHARESAANCIANRHILTANLSTPSSPESLGILPTGRWTPSSRLSCCGSTTESSPSASAEKTSASSMAPSTGAGTPNSGKAKSSCLCNFGFGFQACGLTEVFVVLLFCCFGIFGGLFWFGGEGALRGRSAFYPFQPVSHQVVGRGGAEESRPVLGCTPS